MIRQPRSQHQSKRPSVISKTSTAQIFRSPIHRLRSIQLSRSPLTRAVFETSVGVIHRINERTNFIVHAGRGHPSVADDAVATLVRENSHTTVDLDIERFQEVFDEVSDQRFGQTETEYKEWAVDRLQKFHTTTVTYTGGNNVTYNKTCEPNLSDISVQSIEPVYLPEVRQTTHLKEYTYPYEYYAAGPSRVTIEDGIHRCVHCETHGVDETYTYCANCGAVACGSHIKTERLTGEPVCTGCAITERFALKTKYFTTRRISNPSVLSTPRCCFTSRPWRTRCWLGKCGHDALDRCRFAHRGRHPLGSLRSQVGLAASSGGVVFSDRGKISFLGQRMSTSIFWRVWLSIAGTAISLK